MSVFDKVYPELLKRLDDSNDKIRVAVCEASGASEGFAERGSELLLQALDVFFKCLPQNWSRTLYECPTLQRGGAGPLEAWSLCRYILRNLFVHLDDPNPEAIFSRQTEIGFGFAKSMVDSSRCRRFSRASMRCFRQLLPRQRLTSIASS